MRKAIAQESEGVINQAKEKEIYDKKDFQFLGLYPNPGAHKMVEDCLWLQNHVEPILNEQFSFYGSHLLLTQHDKLTILQNELLLHKKGQEVLNESKLDASLQAHDYMCQKFKEMTGQNDFYKKENEDLKAEIERLKRQYPIDLEKMTRKIQDEARSRIKKMHHM